jgi:hypothetical protein
VACRCRLAHPVIRGAHLLLLAAACWSLGCARPNYAEQGGNQVRVSGGPQPEYAIKQVVGKRKPADLVADDGSVCRTSADRFNATPVGKWISCDWKPS